MTVFLYPQGFPLIIPQKERKKNPTRAALSRKQSMTKQLLQE